MSEPTGSQLKLQGNKDDVYKWIDHTLVRFRYHWLCNTMRIAEVATMITLRLDPELERSVQTTAKNLGLTKSELIRKSIHEYLGGLGRSSPWELGEDIFGKYSSGRGDISMNRKDLVRDKIKAKRK